MRYAICFAPSSPFLWHRGCRLHRCLRPVPRASAAERAGPKQDEYWFRLGEGLLLGYRETHGLAGTDQTRIEPIDP
jgi:hypothetical protein